MSSSVFTNANYVKQQLETVVGSSTIVMKVLALCVIIGYCLGQVESLLPYVIIQPSYILPTNLWIWTYLTSPFIELHFYQAIIDVFMIVLYGKLLQPLWGPTELFAFYFLLNLVVELMVTIFYVVLYFGTGDEGYLFETFIYGQAACLAGFLVAVKQMMGSQVIVNSPFGKIRNRDIPTLLLYVLFVLSLVNFVSLTYLMLYSCGILVSWVYLRFYQRHGNGKRGDTSSDFAFVTFFPHVLHGPVRIISDLVFKLLVKLSICKPFQPTQSQSQSESMLLGYPNQQAYFNQHHQTVAPSATVSLNMPSGALESERRKAKALKALEERLNKLQAQPVGEAKWPSLDDNPTSPSPSFPSPTVCFLPIF